MSMMRLVTCPQAIEAAGRTVPAGTRVVMPQFAVRHLATACRDADAGEPRISAMGCYTRHYCGQDLSDGGSLLAWRGAGIGDQLITAGILAAIARFWPGARLGLVVDPHVARFLWDGATNLPFEIIPEPVEFDAWKSYDYHWEVSGFCDGDQEPDQPNVYRGQLQAIGLDGIVPDEACVPCVPWSPRWDDVAADWLTETRRAADATGPALLWQLAASTPMRSLPPALSAECIRAVVEAFPHVAVILTGSDAQLDGYAASCEVEGIAGTTRGLPLQSVFCLLEWMDALVCPDSCLGHVAACTDLPTVSYWCPFTPESRIATYTNHHPIARSVECSPCWAHEYVAGPYLRGCPLVEVDPSATRHCKGLASITPNEIVTKLQEIL